MRKRDELNDLRSCLNTADDDEMLFVLKARDKHAPALVWLWAVLRELDGEPAKVVKDARECVITMMRQARAMGRQSVGNGQVVLAGVLELIRCANMGIEKEWVNAPTSEDFVRMVLNKTTFEKKENDPKADHHRRSGHTEAGA